MTRAVDIWLNPSHVFNSVIDTDKPFRLMIHDWNDLIAYERILANIITVL